jgi:hypothetical protein
VTNSGEPCLFTAPIRGLDLALEDAIDVAAAGRHPDNADHWTL